MRNNKPNQGEIWFIDLDPVVGHEQARRRPCLVVSDDQFNHSRAQLVMVIPLLYALLALGFFGMLEKLHKLDNIIDHWFVRLVIKKSFYERRDKIRKIMSKMRLKINVLV